jgi:DNA-binding response OmpR family regulator
VRVLIVDDERDTVVSLMAVLRHEGYEVQGAYDGHSALKEAEEFDPDVVLIDLAMPRMSGWDVAREIRRTMGRKPPLLIAISGQYIKAPDELLARVAGFTYYLVKPCDPNALLKLLALRIPGK